MLNQEDDTRWMRQALRAAEVALEAEEVPVGCVIVLGDRVIGRGWNRTESAGDPTAHAEILAISAATSTMGYSRLSGARAYVTVEPCLMCAGALLLARVDEVIFGAPELKFGALGSRSNVLDIQGLNHRFAVRGGVMAEEAASLIRGFFRALRSPQTGSVNGRAPRSALDPLEASSSVLDPSIPRRPQKPPITPEG